MPRPVMATAPALGWTALTGLLQRPRPAPGPRRNCGHRRSRRSSDGLDPSPHQLRARRLARRACPAQRAVRRSPHWRGTAHGRCDRVGRAVARIGRARFSRHWHSRNRRSTEVAGSAPEAPEMMARRSGSSCGASCGQSCCSVAPARPDRSARRRPRPRWSTWRSASRRVRALPREPSTRNAPAEPSAMPPPFAARSNTGRHQHRPVHAPPTPGRAGCPCGRRCSLHRRARNRFARWHRAAAIRKVDAGFLFAEQNARPIRVTP